MPEPLSYKNAVSRFLDAVPEYREAPDNRLAHVADDPKNGQHVVFGGITRFVIEELRAGRMGPGSSFRRALDFMEAAMGSGDAELENLVWVSFLENLQLAESDHDGVKARLGPRLSAALSEIESQSARQAGPHSMSASDLDALKKKYGRYPQFLGIEIVDVNQPGAVDDTLLHIAALKGEREDVRTLLAHGADVNAVGDIGNTPLHGAAGNGHAAVVELLLKHGADPSIKNEFGETPLDWAKMDSHADVVRLLSEHKSAR